MCASKLMLCRAHTGWSWVKCSLVAEVAVIRSREASPARDAAKIVFPNEQNHFSRTSFNEVFISRLLDSTKGLIFWKFQTFLLSLQFWWKGLIKERKGLEMVSHQQKHKTGLLEPAIGQNEENTWMNYKDKIWHEIWNGNAESKSKLYVEIMI